MNTFNKYFKYLNLKIIIFFCRIITIAICLYFTQEVNLCDDGTNTKQWGQDWNKPGVSQDTPYNNEDGNKQNQYKPYNSGLQPTSNGYRYEVDGKSVNYQRTTTTGYCSGSGGTHNNYQPYNTGLQPTSNGYRYELGDHATNYNNAQPSGYNCRYYSPNDIGGSTVSNNTVVGDSLTGSEARERIKNIYTKPLPDNHNIYVKHPKRSIWNAIKDDLNHTRTEAYKSKQSSLYKNNQIMNTIRDSRHSREVFKEEARNKYYSQYPVKVRRFD